MDYDILNYQVLREGEMKNKTKTYIIGMFLAGFMCISFPSGAYAQLPALDSMSFIKTIKQWFTQIQQSQTVINAMKTVQKTSAAIGTAKATVQEYVVENKKKIDAAIKKVNDYKEKAENYKKEFDKYKSQIEEKVQDVKDKVDEVKDKVEDVKNKVEDIKSQAEGYVEQAKSTVQNVKDKVEDVKDKVEDIKDKVEDVKSQAEGYIEQAKDIKDKVEDYADMAKGALGEEEEPVLEPTPQTTVPEVSPETSEATPPMMPSNSGSSGSSKPITPSRNSFITPSGGEISTPLPYGDTPTNTLGLPIVEGEEMLPPINETPLPDDEDTDDEDDTADDELGFSVPLPTDVEGKTIGLRSPFQTPDSETKGEDPTSEETEESTVTEDTSSSITPQTSTNTSGTTLNKPRTTNNNRVPTSRRGFRNSTTGSINTPMPYGNAPMNTLNMPNANLGVLPPITNELVIPEDIKSEEEIEDTEDETSDDELGFSVPLPADVEEGSTGLRSPFQTPDSETEEASASEETEAEDTTETTEEAPKVLTIDKDLDVSAEIPMKDETLSSIKTMQGVIDDKKQSLKPFQKSMLEKDSITIAANIHHQDNMAFAMALSLPDGGTDVNGTFIIPQNMGMSCGNISSNDALEKGVINACLVKYNEERLKAQTDSISEAPKFYMDVLARYAAAVIADAFRLINDADAFEEKHVEPVLYAADSHKSDAYANIVELAKGIDMQINSLLKIYSSQLAMTNIFNYQNFVFRNYSEEELKKIKISGNRGKDNGTSSDDTFIIPPTMALVCGLDSETAQDSAKLEECKNYLANLKEEDGFVLVRDQILHEINKHYLETAFKLKSEAGDFEDVQKDVLTAKFGGASGSPASSEGAEGSDINKLQSELIKLSAQTAKNSIRLIEILSSMINISEIHNFYSTDINNRKNVNI